MTADTSTAANAEQVALPPGKSFQLLAMLAMLATSDKGDEQELSTAMAELSNDETLLAKVMTEATRNFPQRQKNDSDATVATSSNGDEEEGGIEGELREESIHTVSASKQHPDTNCTETVGTQRQWLRRCCMSFAGALLVIFAIAGSIAGIVAVSLVGLVAVLVTGRSRKKQQDEKENAAAASKSSSTTTTHA